MGMILIPVDFSKVSRQAAGFGLSLAKLLDAEVMLLHVQEFASGPYNGGMIAHIGALNNILYGQAQDSLKDFKLTLLKTAATVIPEERISMRFEVGNTADAILSVAEEFSACQVVMGRTSEENVWERLLSSTTAQVVRRTTYSLWIIHRPADVKHFQSTTYFTALSGNETVVLHQIIELAEQLKAKTSIVHVVSKKKNER